MLVRAWFLLCFGVVSCQASSSRLGAPVQCSFNPCFNGGVCVKQGASYTCRCPSHYSGLVCQERNSLIWDKLTTTIQTTTTTSTTTPTILNSPVPTTQSLIPSVGTCGFDACANGGVCFKVGDHFSCVCPAGFSGAICQIVDDPPDNPTTPTNAALTTTTLSTTQLPTTSAAPTTRSPPPTTSPTTTTTPGTCGQGWSLNPDNRKCYKYFKWDQIGPSFTTDKVSLFCQSLGGEVATPKTPEENAFIRDLICPGNSSCWLVMSVIGLTYAAKEDRWIWADGSDLSWSNWNLKAKDYPHANNSHCVIMFPDGTWDRSTCHLRRPVTCCKPARGSPTTAATKARSQPDIIPTQSLPATSTTSTMPTTSTTSTTSTTTRAPTTRHIVCAQGWRLNTDNLLCYKYIQRWMPAPSAGRPVDFHDKASAYCESLGGDVATPKTSEENMFIRDLMNGSTGWLTYTYIGLSYSTEEHRWVWADGSSVSWSNWDSGPDGVDGSCVIMGQDGLWRDIPCGPHADHMWQITCCRPSQA